MKFWDSGRIMAYFGGSGVGLGSAAQKTQAANLTNPQDTVSLLNYPIPLPQIEITLADIITVGGFLVVLSRFIWDIRRDRRDQQLQEQKSE